LPIFSFSEILRAGGQAAIRRKVERSNPTRENQFRAFKEVSVMAWIENQFGDVLLLKQVRGNQLWTLPGGKVHTQESITGALRREVEEEIGLRTQTVALVSVFDRPHKGVITFLYTARIKGRHDAVRPKPTEVVTAKFSSSLPTEATPSLRFFWKRLREGTPGEQ
jgi:ADP-ribose pyrophosphatase YjhB (NUDIX family)